MLFAPWAADVIKVGTFERDWSRHIGTRTGSHSALSLAANRGKRSIAANDSRAVPRCGGWRLSATW
jgi:crotonobetainyl-CoA:carnitine CoA-transferase CaiB-like acyl-CoA transferase